MSYTTSPRLPKGQLKCNLCHKNCPAKLGDWFIADVSSNQQVFLCKECEAGAKGAFRRACLPNLTRG